MHDLDIIHVCPISGKDSLATALLLRARGKENVHYVFCDTGAELPPVYDWLERVEKALGRKIHRIGLNLENHIRKAGVLPSHRMRFCTADAKIKPLEAIFEGVPTIMYIGLRADEEARKGYVPKNKKADIRAEYPLRELNIDLKGVYTIVDNADLRPPSFRWHSVESEVRKQFNDDRFIDNLPEWFISSLFAGRSRPNCYFCFYQRLYELAYMLEEWPEYFRKAAKIEEDVASADEREKPFFWKQGKPMPKISANAEKYKARRISDIVNQLRKMKADARQLKLFVDEGGIEINTTSCGLLCGK